jgi:hypothetical protein
MEFTVLNSPKDFWRSLPQRSHSFLDPNLKTWLPTHWYPFPLHSQGWMPCKQQSDILTKPKFGSCTLQDLYIMPKLFCLRIFQDQSRLIVGCALRTLWQKVIVASCYIYRYPYISFMCNPCHCCLLVSPIHLMCSFVATDKRSHGSMSSHHTPFFFIKNDTHNSAGQPKGTSSREVKLCFQEHIICI